MNNFVDVQVLSTKDSGRLLFLPLYPDLNKGG
jgi:hypothetical protein